MEENNILSDLSFSVDAGLIDRLGKELVGRSETAVSELVKNAYDADSKNVDVNFINSFEYGGTLEIIDDGIGMDYEQLKSGFMTISSSDKVHNPSSLKYKRNKAGRKGIGRFATQGLGKKLTIITQTINSSKALKVIIDWEHYKIDLDLTKIKNSVEEVEKIKEEGTLLIIEGLRDIWTESSIKRIYRYVSDLFQPDYLSESSETLKIAHQDDGTFRVRFFSSDNKQKIEIASPQKMLFDKSIATIEGFVDKFGDGFVSIKSDKLELDELALEINKSKDKVSYDKLKNIHFKAYYFIYNRSEYYTNITKLELANIQKQAKESGGIRLYRNGFRVLPYGESKDDWLGLDIRYSGASGLANIPFGNNNLFGFVEIIDKEGELFQETASREGLLVNTSFTELVDFLNKSFELARLRIAEKITLIRKSNSNGSNPGGSGSDIENNETTLKEDIEQLDLALNKQTDNDEVKNKVQNIKVKFELVLEELSMLRILASLGLTIGEFTHEIIQFTPAINGYLSKLYEINNLEEDSLSTLDNLKKSFANFTSYTSYFNSTVSENTSREIKPILINDVVSQFIKTVKDDLIKQNIDIDIDSYGYDLFTTPMHVSEWSSILYNLYTNSKKAIKRETAVGKIRIITGEENGKIYLEFSDNGDGIPSKNKNRIFNAFFTTSSPAGFESTIDEKLTGTGLGLKIVKDIINNYNGDINIIEPESGYKTCFKIELPKATEKQLKEYGI